MRTKNYGLMTKNEIIKVLNLKQRFYNCFGEEISKDYEVYYGTKETEKAKYVYTLDNYMSADLENGKTYFLTVERYSKKSMVWSDLFNEFIPRKTSQTYEIRG